METVVEVEGSGEEKFEDSVVNNSICNTSLSKQAEDPVVYKLVRVEGDGRLVPATDDEIIEVADLLKDETIDVDIVPNSKKNTSISVEETSNVTVLLENQGFLHCQKDKADTGKLDVRVQLSTFPLVDDSDARNINQDSDAGESSDSPSPKMGSVLSPTTVCGISKPYFSKLRGEICLDNLSIRELHEAFKATFGRDTTVKDKAWLKRRIMMGLTNSGDVSMTNFTIKDGKVLVTGNEGNSKEVYAHAVFSNPLKVVDETKESSAIYGTSYLEDSQVVSLKRLRNHDLVDDYRSDSLNKEELTAKRIRKPTRRYIEELSKIESQGHSRLTSSCQGSGQPSPQLYTTTATSKGVCSNSRTFVMRLDSLAGIQVPCVSRLRRSRPRKDIMSLMFHHSSMEAVTGIMKKALHSYRSAGESGSSYAQLMSTQKQHIEESEKLRHCEATDKIEQDKYINGGDSVSFEGACNDKVVTVPTAKGGIRRKHHRAWTLSEVMKLVDGVSRYGAGRWSEIKRLAFASYSYRTSVDLKDKWRNLLKAANFASAPTDVMNSRKHTTTPIPAPILSRVRELAEINGHALPWNLSSAKVGFNGRSANRSVAGYL
ncbi:hypothetical protein SAY86_017802 [Trapa natans]|uniref:Uncharacterized protein n=1 Tax=Trapa natans TaxID=22666 RepID=A0AAN7LL49_TRANT|nr:hypothetical protein SAY86_017802 [Trapa natans]